MAAKGSEFPVRITREVTYVEVVDAVILATDADEAYATAVGLGNGSWVDWPVLKRYNTWEREPVETRLIEVKFADEDEDAGT